MGTPTTCTDCYSSQNRILLANSCVCDTVGFYDDGSSSICPQCHYTCLSCSGPSAGSCYFCSALYFRQLTGSTCLCMNGYYDNSVQLCATCHVTCLTCTSSSSTSCITCDILSYREYASTGACKCLAGYFDATSTTKVCTQCHYSCLTCSTSNSNCLTC